MSQKKIRSFNIIIIGLLYEITHTTSNYYLFVIANQQNLAFIHGQQSNRRHGTV